VVIPTVLIIALVVGRWWIVPLAGLGWALLLTRYAVAASRSRAGSSAAGAGALGPVSDGP
jgi:hypothetical protein